MRQEQIPIPERAPQNQFPLHKINIRAGTRFKLQITCCNSITLLQGRGPSLQTRRQTRVYSDQQDDDQLVAKK